MDCNNCEHLLPYPIKVVDIEGNLFQNETYHFENGFKCTYNGEESLDIKNLQKSKCRCI